ncbi:hypothetical protein SAMN05443667_11531 [Flavobacterium gillisiae]|jgi:cell division protein FtsL|uniref:Uncharacterized protein n=1 Tax=Flavobacterium gillisiae TaxID=150146 RepID=A0A1H4FW75_9FLAO|nr:hypothetical protein [Flavobacterium gillisiae]SEB01100.1 hypothetical protein SAMN05443667_11531 [Flavobacterium gillisiae]
MNNNRLKHKLLKILSKQYVISGFENAENTEIGLNDDIILPLLKVSIEEYELLKMSLFEEKEVFRHNPKYKLGLYATDKGVASFVNKKYKKRNEDIILNWFKVFVQIVVPVLALIIAVLSLTIKLDTLKMQSDKELQKLENIMQEQQLSIEKLEMKTKTLPNHKKNTSE